MVAIDWKGDSVKVEASEFILSLKLGTRLIAGRGADGQVKALQRALDARTAAAGFTVEEFLGQPGDFLLDVPQDRTYEQVQATVKTLRGFEFVEPNFVFQLEATPDLARLRSPGGPPASADASSGNDRHRYSGSNRRASRRRARRRPRRKDPDRNC